MQEPHLVDDIVCGYDASLDARMHDLGLEGVCDPPRYVNQEDLTVQHQARVQKPTSSATFNNHIAYLPHEQRVPLPFTMPPLDMSVEFKMRRERLLPRHEVAI
jgi:hypothetical protein